MSDFSSLVASDSIGNNKVKVLKVKVFNINQ
jgi:hypothetical protein